MDHECYGELKSKQASSVVGEAFSFEYIYDRAGSPTRRAMEVAAMASVGATTAPSTNPRRQSKPTKTVDAIRATATTTTVNPTKPKARRKMRRHCL